jgi:hypothetical protein
MLLVDAVEERIGAPVVAWPTSILTILFAFDPHVPLALHRVTQVIAFMFGNCVPLSMACRFFAACSFHPLHLVTHQFSYLYNDWSLFPSCTTKSLYYDIYDKRWKYTDGTYGSAFPPPAIGLEGTGFPHDRPQHFTAGEPAGVGRGGRLFI